MNEINRPVGLFLGSKAAIARAYSPNVRGELFARLTMLERERFSETDEALRNVEFLFSTWGMPAFGDEEIRRSFPALTAVFYAAGSVQAFAKPFLQNGVKVFSAWGANAVPVAETAVAEIILANKGFFQTVHHGQNGEWPEHDCGRPFPGNYNTKVGLLGAGMIGTLVIRILKKYRLDVLVFDPFLTEERAKELEVTKVDRPEELFEQCAVISNHLADKPQTAGLIDRRCFEKMGANAVFLNTGRGRTVNESDLIAALTEQPTRAAVLDVTEPEPPQAGNALYTLPNVFLTPHLAGSLGNEVQRMGEAMLDEFLLYAQGKPTRYEVTQAMLDTMA